MRTKAIFDLWRVERDEGEVFKVVLPEDNYLPGGGIYLGGWLGVGGIYETSNKVSYNKWKSQLHICKKTTSGTYWIVTGYPERTKYRDHIT